MNSDLVELLFLIVVVLLFVVTWVLDFIVIVHRGRLILVLLFLRVRIPPGTIRDKLGRLDVLYVENAFNMFLHGSHYIPISGNVIIIAGTTLALIGLTWGGVAYKWTSAHTLATMIIGLVLMGAFFVYEWLVPQDPSIPWEVVGNRTTVSAYVLLFSGLSAAAH